MAEVPLYERVRLAIAASIDDGTYAPGERLPSESRLAEDLGVNRLTVRRAIEELARAGIIESRQGSGTYVSAPIVRLPVSQKLSTDSLVSGMTAQIAAQGYTYEDVFLRAKKVDAGPARASLELPEGPLWRVDNAIVVNGDTWMWSSSWFPRHLLKDPETNWSTSSGLYGQLNQVVADLRPIWRAISADAASLEDAETLGVRAGSPILVRDGLTADETDRPVLRVTRRARMDRVSYVLRYDAE
ncbi:MAG: GntR family transcriptional regulator [Candidatus Nanopelagicales bacterium]|nr:GntR family transcriptional regulator [Candidatus Nanopelagicales bacterium]